MLRRSAAAVCLVLASTGSGLALAAPAPAASAASAVEITLRQDRIMMPDLLRPGVQKFAVTFRGSEGGLVLLAPKDGYTVALYKDDIMTASFKTGRAAVRAERSLYANVARLGGVYGAQGRTVVFWQKVQRGRLWATSSRFAGFDLARVTVRGQRTTTTVPAAADLAVSDGAIGTAEDLAAGEKLRVHNSGTVWHSIAMLSLKPGKTIADVHAFLAAYEAAEGDEALGVEDPVDETGPQLSTQSLSPGRSVWLRTDLPAGHYLVICTELDLRGPAGVRMHLQDGELAVLQVS